MIDTRHRRQTAFRVLLVEDNPADARLVRILLSEAGPTAAFEITHVGRLEEAIQRIEGAEFDVVLLDLSLPDASGLETVGRIQSVAPHLPVVVLSGLSDEEVAVQAIQGGAEDYLVKGQGDGDLISRSIRYAIERKRAEDHLAYLSNYDPLTQLANRVLFQDRLEQALARADRNESLVALLFLDLDRFKAFNDTYGHPAGDALLRETAAAWRAGLPADAVLARYGGEEFAVLLPGYRLDQATGVVARLRDRTPAGQTFSAGVCEWRSAGRPEPAALVAHADQALYRAKRNGRDRVEQTRPARSGAEPGAGPGSAP